MNEVNPNDASKPVPSPPSNQPPQNVTAPAPVVVTPQGAPTAPVAPQPTVAAAATPVTATAATPQAPSVNAVPAAAAVPSPIAQSVATAPVSSSPAGIKPSSSMKAKWLLPVAFIAVLLLGGGAAAYISVFNKSPSQIWSSGLDSMAGGLDKLIESEEDTAEAVQFDATFKMSQPAVVDGSASGVITKGGSGEFKMDIGAAGFRTEAEFRMIPAEGSEYPDLYLKASGIKSYAALIGAAVPVGASDISTILNDVDDQWYSVDHTLFAQIGELAGARESSSETDIDVEAYREDAKKIAKTLRETLFSSTDGTAVFEVKENIGKEDFEGTSTYKFEAGISSGGLENLITELSKTLQDTVVGKTFMDSAGYSSLSDLIDNPDEVIETIDKEALSEFSMDVWIATHGKYVRNIRIYPSEDKKESYIDISMPYEGGDTIPFQIKLVVNDEDATGEVVAKYEINSKTKETTATMTVDMSSNGADDFAVNMSFELNSSEYTEELNVDKPQGAKNIYELFGAFTESYQSGLPTSYDYEDYNTAPTTQYGDWGL